MCTEDPALQSFHFLAQCSGCMVYGPGAMAAIEVLFLMPCGFSFCCFDTSDVLLHVDKTTASQATAISGTKSVTLGQRNASHPKTSTKGKHQVVPN